MSKKFIDLPQTGVVKSGDRFLLQDGLVSKQVDWDVLRGEGKFILHDTLLGATTRTDVVEGTQIRISDRGNGLFEYQVGTGGEGAGTIDAANGLQVTIVEINVDARMFGLVYDTPISNLAYEAMIAYSKVNNSSIDTSGSFTGLTSLTLRVPEDFSNLQLAVDFAYNMKVNSNVVIDVVISTGYVIDSGVHVANGNYSNIQISSIDPTVYIDPLLTDVLINGNNAVIPTLNTLIDAEGNGGYASIAIEFNSSGTVNVGAGVINGAGRGLYCNHNSSCEATGVIFTGHQGPGLWVSRTCQCECANANFSGNMQSGVGTNGNMYASRNSRINGADVIATNSGVEGIRSQRMSVITVPDIDVSGAQSYAAVATLGGKIYASTGPMIALNLQTAGLYCGNAGVLSVPTIQLSSATGDGSNAVEVRSASTCDISSGVISGFAGVGVFSNESSKVNFRDGAITGGSNILVAEQLGEISARSVIITGATGSGALAQRGGKILVSDGSITGSGSNDIAVSGGSVINADGTTTTNGIGSPDITDTNLTGGFNFADNNNRGFIWI